MTKISHYKWSQLDGSWLISGNSYSNSVFVITQSPIIKFHVFQFWCFLVKLANFLKTRNREGTFFLRGGGGNHTSEILLYIKSYIFQEKHILMFQGRMSSPPPLNSTVRMTIRLWINIKIKECNAVLFFISWFQIILANNCLCCGKNTIVISFSKF